MHPLIALLGIILAALTLLWLSVALERWLRRPGLAYLLAGIAMLLVAALEFSEDAWLLAGLFLLQAPMFFYFARLKQTAARATRASEESSD